MNNRWLINILMPIFLAHSTCHTASLVKEDNAEKKDVSTQDQTSYDDRRHWLTIVTCLEHNPHDTPTLEGWTIYNQSSDISRKIVSLRTDLLLGSEDQTPEQHLQAQRLAYAIKPSLMEKNSELWKAGNNLWCAKNALVLIQTRLSILQQGKPRNLGLENKKKEKIHRKQQEIKNLECTIVKLATQTMIASLAQYVANQQKLDNIMQGKTP